jgi:hypothetical protein
MSEEITLNRLRTMAEQAGLKLSDEQLQGLLPGVNRSRKQVSELRELISDSLEPASNFCPAKTEKS